MKIKYIIPLLLLTGCDVNLSTQISSNENIRYECDESVSQSRADFIKSCVTDLKSKLLICESLSERIFCKLKTKIEEPKQNDAK